MRTGARIESNDYRQRADYLRQVPAMVRFVSYEPAIGPLGIDLTGINWLMYGGESGHGAHTKTLGAGGLLALLRGLIVRRIPLVLKVAMVAPQ
jgi:hypothetical protein